MGSSSWQGESSKFQVQGSKAIKAPSTGKGKVASTEEKTEGVEVAKSNVESWYIMANLASNIIFALGIRH